MREILFRGKKLSNGEWYEGDLLVSRQRKIGLILPNNGKECKIIDPETVGEFTGLTDKNGKKIFEGDIVRRFNGRGQEVMRYAVKWNTDCCMFVLMCEDTYLGEYDSDFTVFYGEDLEVIGNILICCILIGTTCPHRVFHNLFKPHILC